MIRLLPLIVLHYCDGNDNDGDHDVNTSPQLLLLLSLLLISALFISVEYPHDSFL